MKRRIHADKSVKAWEADKGGHRGCTPMMRANGSRANGSRASGSLSRSRTRARFLLVAVGLALLMVAGAGTGAGCNWLTGTRKPPKPKQGVIIKVNRHRAALYINEEPVTLLSSRKPNVVGLAPGRYRIAIKKAGFFARYYDVSVRRDAFAKLQVKLHPELE
jgi:hypothetical protein